MKAIIRLMSVPAPKRDLPWLQDALQAAIQLELGTIPPYLYAYWSIKPGTADPDSVAQSILTIAVEEMQHMGIVCNLLASTCGHPDILGAVSKYPTMLPKDIHKGLQVGLASLSRDVVLKTFMVIEEPEAHIVDDPDFTPTGSLLIGQFYDAVQTAFEQFAPQPLRTAKQVDMSGVGFGNVITTIDDAKQAIALIKRQGEGSSAFPFEAGEELAHFYQFGQIAHAKKIKQTQDNPPRFAYTGDNLTVPAAVQLPIAGAESADFNQKYSDLIRSLQSAWDQGGTQGATTLSTAVFSGMSDLDDAARALVKTGKGPSFVFIPTPAPLAVLRLANAGRFAQVLGILDAAVGGGTFGAHGPFWRGKTRDQFVQLKVFGRQLLIVGNGRDSNLIHALRGQLPFGSDTGTAGAIFRRMPAGRPPVADADIAVVEQWINDGCPDDAPHMFQSLVSFSTGAQRPDPMVHVAFWRDLDDWSLYHPSPEVQDAIGAVFNFFPAWQSFARDGASEKAWTAALAADGVQAAVALLSARQKQTVESHYGTPVPLLAVLDGFERFGNNGLPDDPLRPKEPRHNMNGPIMWFVWSAFAEACLRLDVSADFWRFYTRAILCGLLNDGVYRGRFKVQGFTADPEGYLKIYAYSQQVADADLPAELRARYVQSGL
jgi:hypothetical protein